MTDSPQQPTNKVVEKVNAVIDRCFDYLASLGEKLVAGKLPWLNFWPLNAILRSFLNKKADQAARLVKQRTTKIIIDKQVDNEVEQAEDAGQKLKQAGEEGDPNAIQNASDKFDEEYGDLVRSNGNVRNGN